MLTFAVFALLPLALLSLFERGRHRHTAGFAFLAALAPMIAKGALSLIKHKQQGSANKQAEEQRKLEAAQADTLARQQWEAQQNSSGAQAGRFKNTFSLGRLAGAMGGLANIPKSIADYYQSGRKMPEYAGTSSYVPTAKKGGGIWDFASGLGDALSYLDTSKFGKGGGATPMSPGQPVGGSSFGGGTNFLGGLTSRLKGGGYKPFDAKLGG